MPKSETRMTASVLKQFPNTRKVQKQATYWDKTQHGNFQTHERFRSKLLIGTKHNMAISKHTKGSEASYLLGQNTTWQFPNTRKVQKQATYWDKTQHGNFQTHERFRSKLLIGTKHNMAISKHAKGSEASYLLGQNTTWQFSG